MYYDNTL